MLQVDMGLGVAARCIKSSGFLKISLLLVSIFAVGEPQVECPLDVGNLGGLTHLTNDLKVGSIAKFLCTSGAYPWPTSSRTCLANGKWSDMRSSTGRKISKISCKKIRCPEPVHFDNGELQPRGPYEVGKNITFVCNDGYIPRGSMQRTCKRNGKWSGETAVCDDGAGHCPDPGVPPGAMKTGIRYDVDESVSYKCSSGLSLMGSSRRTCSEQRRWTGTEVSCQYPYAFDLPEEVGEYFAGSLSGLLRTSEKKKETKGRTVKIEKDGILNVYILLDASQSVGKDNFQTSKDCAEILVKKLGAFDMKIQFGILSYATEPNIIINVHDEDSDDADQVLELIETNLDYSKHKDKSGTNTNGALKAVLDMMSFQEDAYKNKTIWNSIRHVIILLTDGKANMGGRPVDTVKRIKHLLNITQSRTDYLDIYAFGIGEDLDKVELSDIASQKEKEKHVFILNDADGLKDVFKEILEIQKHGEMCGLNDMSDSDIGNQYPWNVLMTSGTKSPCFASLISSSWVLTAAHCFKDGNPPNTYTFDIGGQTYNGDQLKIHECYQLNQKENIGIKENYDYDVALVKLNKKVTFSKSARPICIPCTEPANRAMKKGKSATCNDHRDYLFDSSDKPAGFLSKDTSDSSKPKKLEELKVEIKTDKARDSCLSAIKKFDPFKNINVHDLVSPRHLCVEGKLSCKGESGGSLFVDTRDRQRFFQVGILSFGIYDPCKNGRAVRKQDANARDFYINVLEILPWLRKHIPEEELEFLPEIQKDEVVVCPT